MSNLPDLPTPYVDEFGDAEWLTRHSTTAYEGTEIEHEVFTRVHFNSSILCVEVTTAHTDFVMDSKQAISVAWALLAAADYADKENDNG